MEKLKQLPVGYRFVPSDLELIVDYLIKKLTNKQFSCNAVVEHDVYTTEPWNLKGNKDDIGGAIDKTYYFVNREKKSAAKDRGTNPSRVVKSGNGTEVGCWKATGGEKQILDKRNKCVGVKKSLKYLCFIIDEQRMTKNVEKTDWIMHEYTLPPRDNRFQPWVLCSIRFKGNDVDYQKQHQKYLEQETSHQKQHQKNLEQEASHQQVEPVILQEEAPHQQGKQQLLMPMFKLIDDEEDMIMLDYAKEGVGVGGGGLPQACEASSTSMSGSCSSSANHHQDVPVQDQDWEGLDDFLWTAADEYSYGCHMHPGTAAFIGTDQQCAVPPAGGFGLNNKFN